MSYRAALTRAAQRDLRGLDPRARERILRAISNLADSYEDRAHRALTGDLAGAFRLRVGDYRVVYTADHNERSMLVRFIRHRKDVYR